MVAVEAVDVWRIRCHGREKERHASNKLAHVDYSLS
jgi:hypothetical protein